MQRRTNPSIGGLINAAEADDLTLPSQSLRACQQALRAMIPGTALFCALLLTGCGSSKDGEKGARPTPQAGFIVATPTSVPQPVTLGGRTVAFETSEVRPQVAGVIQRRLFTEGSYVREGQPLFQIDPSLYRASVNQAQANLASARASAEAAVARARRFKPLAEMEAISAQDYTDAAAQARVARAAIDQSAAALETARVNLRFATVPAPISGYIGRALVTVGGLASPSQAAPLAIIQRTDPMFVDMKQSAADLTALRLQLRRGGVNTGSTNVTLKFEDGSDYALEGTVQFSEVTVDLDAGTVNLRARFPNPEGLLLPGMFVNAVFNQAIQTNVFLVPQQALQRDFDGSAFVMLVSQDNKAVRRKVNATRTYGTSWVVDSGLQRGDRIILQGLNGLKQGAPIRPVPANAPQDPSAKQEPPGKGGAGTKAGNAPKQGR